MGLNYKVEKRSFGFDPEKTERYVATAVRGDTVSFERGVSPTFTTNVTLRLYFHRNIHKLNL